MMMGNKMFRNQNGIISKQIGGSHSESDTSLQLKI